MAVGVPIRLHREAPLDRHHTRIAAGPHKGVGLLRGKPGIQAKRTSGIAAPEACPVSASISARRFHTASRAVSPISTRCSTSQDSLPRPKAQTDASMRSFLHVGRADQQQTTLRHRTDAVVLAAFDQSLPVRRFAFLDPGFA